jgi:hypothetical protein
LLTQSNSSIAFAKKKPAISRTLAWMLVRRALVYAQPDKLFRSGSSWRRADENMVQLERPANNSSVLDLDWNEQAGDISGRQPANNSLDRVVAIYKWLLSSGLLPDNAQYGI